MAAHNDTAAFRKRFGHRIAYRGGVDKRAIAARGSTFQAVLDRLSSIVESGGYIPSCDYGVPPDVFWDNFVDALLSLISSSPHTRIPIYEDSVDTIIGVVHTKDILQKVVGSDKPLTDIRSLIRPDSAMFVPENKKVDEMLLEFRMERKHLAIVVDEYGGTEGLVTFEDLLEEIVGDIRDEYDEAEESDWVWLDDNTIVVDGAATISNVNEEPKFPMSTVMRH